MNLIPPTVAGFLFRDYLLQLGEIRMSYFQTKISIGAASGTQSLIAGVPNHVIHIYKIQFTSDSATNI